MSYIFWTKLKIQLPSKIHPSIHPSQNIVTYIFQKKRDKWLETGEKTFLKIYFCNLLLKLKFKLTKRIKLQLKEKWQLRMRKRLSGNINTWEDYMVKQSTDGFMLDPLPLVQLKLSNVSNVGYSQYCNLNYKNKETKSIQNYFYLIINM